MTTLPEQNNPFHDPALPSLADALEKFEGLPNETASRKARARSSVATISRLLHKEAKEIPAHAPFLLSQFKRLKHVPTGLSKKALANCKTELRYLMRTVSGRTSRSSFAPLTHEWKALRESLGDVHTLWALSRFMAFCSAQGVAPADVNDRVVERFSEALRACEEVADPECLVTGAIRAWNRLVQIYPAWPAIILSVKRAERRTWTFPASSFVGSFQADVEAWLRRLANSDPEEEDGLLRACRPSTITVRRYQLYQAASALVRSGQSIQTLGGLSDLVRPDAFKAIMRYLREQQRGVPTHGLANVAKALISVARHHVGVDEITLQSMKNLRAKYNMAIGTQSKRRRKLDSFEDDRVLAALLGLPRRLLEEAARVGTRAQRAAYLAQIAVAIEIEIFAPLRLGNLASIHIERHIKVIRIGRERRWLVSFPAHETKNRRELTYELPATSVDLIERAFRFYRQTNGFVFPSPKGTFKRSIGLQVKREVEQRLGVPFHLHLFRSLMAALQVKENDSFEMARALLGDRSERVVRAHYTSTAEKKLVEKAQRTISKLRARTAALADRGRHPEPHGSE
jgi:integrase